MQSKMTTNPPTEPREKDGIKKQEVLDLIEKYRKQHKRDFFSFLRGFMPGYGHSPLPTYEESSLIDFKIWIEDEYSEDNL